MKIKELLRMNIEEEVPLVIKAGEQDLEIEQKEISQYIVTHQIERHIEDFLKNYKLASTDRIGVWISGFFGSGKSYFAKILSYLLSNHPLQRGITARELFNERLGNCTAPEFLKGSIESLNSIAATVVMFEIIAEGAMTTQTIQQVMLKKLLQKSGYSSVPSVAIMEYELDTYGHLEKIREDIEAKGGDYATIAKNAGEFRRSAVTTATDKLGYSQQEIQDFLKSAVEKYDTLSPVDFAQHCVDYASKTGNRLVFIIDEIGQYVTSVKDNDDRILALQGVVETFAAKGKGSVRLIVTSQEKLDQLIANSSFDKRKLGKLIDRFEVRLDLTSENVDEVARERLLKKKIETEPLFATTLLENQGNITTISNTDGSYRKTDTKDQFMTYYPFHPYHFQLLPDLVQNTRSMTYTQATARKFIFLVDSILKHLKDEDFGRVVNATDLFDALGAAFFGTEVTALVNSAEDYRGENVKASDVLKALQILKNLTKITATETVITRMLCKNLFDKQYDLTREVKDALDYLEKTRYVTRYNGEITLVTDLEREFIAEMDSTEMDSPKRNDEIVRQLLNIFNYKELSYEKGPSIPVEWYYENNPKGGKKRGLKVAIASFANENIEGFEFESMNHADTVYVIPEEDDTIDTLAGEIKKLEASLNSFRTKKTGGDIHEILTKYAKMMEGKQIELARVMRGKLEAGTLIYSGEKLTGAGGSLTGTGGSLTGINLLNALKVVLKERVIPGYYTEITSATATEKDIEFVLTKPQNTLKTIRVDEDLCVFDENGELIETHKIISPLIQSLSEDSAGSGLLEKFSSPPYGWTQDTILYSVACLMRGGKITINHIDSYSKPEMHKVFKNLNDFKNAKIRKNAVLSTDDRQQLLKLINPLLGDGKLILQSPRSEFISRALQGINLLDKKLKDLKKQMEELGAEVDWELSATKIAINALNGGGDDCLDKLLAQKTVILELKETTDKTEAFLRDKYELILKQKVFLKEIEGELSKDAFDVVQSEVLSSLVKEYKDTLPNIASFGTDLDGIFERLRNTYKGYFNAIHNERDERLMKIREYTNSIHDDKNVANQRAGDQPWFRKPTSPCSDLKISYSITCEKCHIGFREATLEIESLQSKLKEMEISYEKFMQPIIFPQETLPKDPTQRLRLKRKLTYRQLKTELEKLSLSDNTEIEIELED